MPIFYPGFSMNVIDKINVSILLAKHKSDNYSHGVPQESVGT